eukprot:jgi/Mesen1/9320/ME000604S08830
MGLWATIKLLFSNWTLPNGRISSVTQQDEAPHSSSEAPVVDYGNAVISPGLVDTHVHLNEPGRSDWEGFATGTRAAAAAGVTVVVDMPLNSEPTTISASALQAKLSAAKGGKLMVDAAFWGGLVPDNAHDMAELEALFKLGVVGLKAFMCPSGINDFPATNITHLEAAMPVLAKYRSTLLVHAEVELPRGGEGEEKEKEGADVRRYATYLASRPPSWEREAIRQVAELARHTAKGGKYEGARLHIVHLSDAASLSLIQAARAEGAALTVETCTHYLTFDAESVPDGATQYKCAPPIRSDANRQMLWQSLQEGAIDMIASDHSPAPPAMKHLESGDFSKAWGGISGLQFDLAGTWTAARGRDVSAADIAKWWSENPARLAKLDQKGSIEANKDADLVVWDPEASFAVDANFTIFHRHKVTPYAGRNLNGRVLGTYVRGSLVYSKGVHAENGCGLKLLQKYEEAMPLL